MSNGSLPYNASTQAWQPDVPFRDSLRQAATESSSSSESSEWATESEHASSRHASRKPSETRAAKKEGDTSDSAPATAKPVVSDAAGPDGSAAASPVATQGLSEDSATSSPGGESTSDVAGGLDGDDALPDAVTDASSSATSTAPSTSDLLGGEGGAAPFGQQPAVTTDPILREVHRLLFPAHEGATGTQSATAAEKSERLSLDRAAVMRQTSGSASFPFRTDSISPTASGAASSLEAMPMFSVTGTGTLSAIRGLRVEGKSGVGVNNNKKSVADAQSAALNGSNEDGSVLKSPPAASGGEDSNESTSSADAGEIRAQDNSAPVIAPISSTLSMQGAPGNELGQSNANSSGHDVLSRDSANVSEGIQRDALPATAASSPDASMALNSVKLMQRVGQSEMTIGMQSSEFGAISIRTSTMRDQVAAEVTVSHDALGKALISHLPEMQSRLTGERPIDVRISNTTTHAAADTGQGSSSANTSGGENQRHYTKSSVPVQERKIVESPSLAAIAAGTVRSQSSRLDIQA